MIRLNYILFIVLTFISCSAQEEITIRKDIFGFATSNSFTYCDFSDSVLSNKIVHLKPRLLRFPGGAVGNFYHFNQKGYGLDFDEIDRYHAGKFPKRSRGLESSRKKLSHNHDYIDDLIQLAKKIDSDVVLVANPYVENDDDIIKMIDKLKINNINVVGVELGSELSNRSYYQKGYTINDYVVFAQRCSNRIKKKYPLIKTAVVAAPLGKKLGHRHNIWNITLSKLDFYDAIIIHSYAKVIKGKSLDGQMITEVNDFNNDKFKFDQYKQRALKYLNEDYPKEINTYNKIFGKPIWVTEWNLQISKTTGNSFLQGLFVAQFLLEILSNNDLSSIHLTTFHNLAGRDISGSIFNGKNDDFEVHSTFQPLTYISEIFKKNIDTVIKEQISNNHFIYKCFEKNKEILNYSLDWNNVQIQVNFVNNENNSLNKIFQSKNLFDKATKEGKFNN